MPRFHGSPTFFPVLLALASCGPIAPPPADEGSSGAAETGAPADVTSGGATGPTSSDGPTSSAATTGDSSTTDASTGAVASTGGAPSTTDASTDGTTTTTTGGDEPQFCGMFCEEDARHCPLEARINAAVTGTTPLGEFTGTFAAFSGALAFGELGTLVVVPEYLDGDLCGDTSRLVLELGPIGVGDSFVVQAPARHVDAGGQFVDTIAEVTVEHCCELMWFCWCQSSTPFDLTISIQAEGWSLTGTAAPNCCRSYSIDEAA